MEWSHFHLLQGKNIRMEWLIQMNGKEGRGNRNKGQSGGDQGKHTGHIKIKWKDFDKWSYLNKYLKLPCQVFLFDGILLLCLWEF